jgi:hypothetical protein
MSNPRWELINTRHWPNDPFGNWPLPESYSNKFTHRYEREYTYTQEEERRPPTKELSGDLDPKNDDSNPKPVDPLVIIDNEANRVIRIELADGSWLSISTVKQSKKKRRQKKEKEKKMTTVREILTNLNAKEGIINSRVANQKPGDLDRIIADPRITLTVQSTFLARIKLADGSWLDILVQMPMKMKKKK